MTVEDVLVVDIGDSVIGLNDRWDDELPIVSVGDVRHLSGGHVCRTVVARCGRGYVRGVVNDGDSTVLGPRRFGCAS